MPRVLSNPLWFIGIVLMLMGWEKDDGVLFGLGALLAVIGSKESCSDGELS